MKETLLDILDYENQLNLELNLAKKEAEKIVQDARKTAKDIVEEERAKHQSLHQGSEEALKNEVEEEKKRILQEKEEKLKSLSDMGKIKIEGLIGSLLKKIAGIYIRL